MGKKMLVWVYGKRVEIFREVEPENPYYLYSWIIPNIVFNLPELEDKGSVYPKDFSIGEELKDPNNLGFPLTVNRMNGQIQMESFLDIGNIGEEDGFVFVRNWRNFYRTKEEAKSAMEKTVKMMSAYLTGNVYGYRLIENNEVIDESSPFYLTDSMSVMIEKMKEEMEEQWSYLI